MDHITAIMQSIADLRMIGRLDYIFIRNGKQVYYASIDIRRDIQAIFDKIPAELHQAAYDDAQDLLIAEHTIGKMKCGASRLVPDLLEDMFARLAKYK